MVRVVYLVYIDLNVYLFQHFLTKSILISIIMMELIQPFNTSFSETQTDGVLFFATLRHTTSSSYSSPQRGWKMQTLDGVESGGVIIWIQGQIRVVRPMKLVDGVHYSATELHSRSGCHVKQRDTAAEVTHAHILPSSAVGRLLPRTWHVVVVNGYS